MYQQYPHTGVPGTPQPKVGWWQRRKIAKQVQQAGANPSVANYQQSVQMMKVVGKNNDMVQFMHQYPEHWVNIVKAIEVAVARLDQLQRKHMKTTIIIPEHETVGKMDNGKDFILKIPAVTAEVKMEYLTPDDKPAELSIHEKEYETVLNALRPNDMRNLEKATLESEYKKMEEEVMGAVQPPPEMMQPDPYGQPYGPQYGPPYQEEQQGVGGKLLGFGLDTLAYQATGKPRQPPPPSPY
jgi:hypothetical protein